MKAVAKLLRTLGTVLLVGMILACVPVVAPKLAGLEVYAVISGSMEPTIPTGSLVYVEKITAKDLLANDIIAFNSPVAGGGVITHRVVEVLQDERSLITKGDANSSVDVTPVRFEQLIGRVKAYLPGLGKIALFLNASAGKAAAAGIVLGAILLNILASVFEKKEAKKASGASASVGFLFCVGILLIGLSGFCVFRIWNDYHSSNRLYDHLDSEYVETAAPVQKEDVPWYEQISVDLAGLQEQNPDVKGWIYFENEDISYPVLYSGDDETYLRRTMDKKSATAGSIFIEGKNSPDFEDSHTLIYGHNMRNLSMFGKLKFYKEDPEYYADHMYFQIIKEDAVYRYRIFAYEDVSADSFVYAVPFGPTDDFAQFISQICESSYCDTGVTVTKEDQIITLSTCGTTSGEGRFVVHAVKVDEYRH